MLLLVSPPYPEIPSLYVLIYATRLQGETLARMCSLREFSSYSNSRNIPSVIRAYQLGYENAPAGILMINFCVNKASVVQITFPLDVLCEPRPQSSNCAYKKMALNLVNEDKKILIHTNPYQRHDSLCSGCAPCRTCTDFTGQHGAPKHCRGVLILECVFPPSKSFQ